MNLDLSPQKFDFHYDEKDTNAINFILKNGYFAVSVCVYMERDQDELNLQHFEYNDQGGGEYKKVDGILFTDNSITISFQEPFLKEYDNVILNFDDKIDRKMVDFFSNHLFLGEAIRYANNFDASNKVQQTEFREFVDDE